MEMLKSCFILKNKVIYIITLVIFLNITLFANSNIKIANQAYMEKNYIKAAEYYKKAYDKNNKKARIKLLICYIKLGDNFSKIRNYEKALSWYSKALNLKSSVAKSKIAKIYEKQADQYKRIKDYKTAMMFYKKSLKLNNTKVAKKIKSINKILNHQKRLVDDSRELVSYTSPTWTKAIGRLIIPTHLKFISKKRYKTKYKKCSASLVNLDNTNSSNIVVTASHCLTNYDKNTGDIRFIIKNSNDQMVQRIAKVHIDSHYNSKKLKTVSDYAILILDKKISQKDVKPFIIKKDNFISLKKRYKASFGSLAGFSSDIGEYGAQLTYDPKCELSFFSKTYGASNCSGFKGASGGPVVMTTTNDNINFKHHFVGVVSHFKNKKFQQIYFAPHHIFYNELVKSIKN